MTLEFGCSRSSASAMWMRPCAIALLGLAGCTSVDVNPVDVREHDIDLVCIRYNEKVEVSDLVGVIERRFSDHGVKTRVTRGDHDADNCAFTLDYTARRGWDLKPYLKFAEFTLRENGVAIGSAVYRHGGGFDFGKFAGTESKINPVVDELLGMRVEH